MFIKPAVFTVPTIASGATLSSMITIPIPRNQIQLEIPTMASGTDVYIQASNDGSTFRRVYHGPTISVSNPAALFVNSAVTNCHVDLGVLSNEYIKIELSTAMTATSAQFKILIS